MLKASRTIPIPELALDFGSMLFRDYPTSYIWLNLLRGWHKFSTNMLVPREPGQIFGAYCDSLAEVKCEIVRVVELSIYICPNPIRKSRVVAPHLKNNLGRVHKGEAPHIEDIEYLRWVLLDIDPIVPGGRKGLNSTDAEHRACLDLRRLILEQEPMIKGASLSGSSGNGAFLLVRAQILPSRPKRAAKFPTLFGRWHRSTAAQARRSTETGTPPKRSACPAH